jgi:Ca2+-binding EF-hand superfamily protein
MFDKNGVGSFGVEEFGEICESVGERFSQTEIEQMIEYADKDRDGRINFSEFVEVVTKEYPPV